MEMLLALALVAVLVAGHELMWRRVRCKWLATAIGAGGGYLYIAALAFVLFTCRGVDTQRSWYGVDEVLPGYDATGKLLPGDRIVAVDGLELHTPSTPSLVDAVNAHRGAPVMLDVMRAGTKVTLEVRPTLDHRNSGDVWVLGIKPTLDRDFDRSFGSALGHALTYPFAKARSTITELFESEPVEVGGPKRMVEEFRKAFEGWIWLRAAMAFSTIALVVLILCDLFRAAVSSPR